MWNVEWLIKYDELPINHGSGIDGILALAMERNLVDW